MSITTASELKTAVADWMARSDLTSYLDDFITLAEGYLNRELRHRKMVAQTDLTPTSGSCTLPTDYLHYVRVVEKASIRRELSFVTPQFVDEWYPARTSGLSNDFTIIGSTLTMYPVSSNDIELTYYQKLPTLVSNSSNWLLADTPGLYLNACKLMALEFVNETDTPRFATVARMTRQLVDEMNAESEMALYHNAGMRISGATP